MSGNTLLNFAGPADVFTYADKCLPGSVAGYDVVIASPTAVRKKVKTSSGMEIHCQCCVSDITTPIDTLIIAGNDFAELNNPANSDFINGCLKSPNTTYAGSLQFVGVYFLWRKQAY